MYLLYLFAPGNLDLSNQSKPNVSFSNDITKDKPLVISMLTLQHVQNLVDHRLQHLGNTNVKDSFQGEVMQKSLLVHPS